MLQLKNSRDSLELSGRDLTVSLKSNQVAIGDVVIDSPGEYEAGGVEVIYGPGAALLAWERLQIVYVFNPELVGAFEKQEFSPCDVTIISQTKEAKTVQQLLETFDPRIVVIDNTLSDEMIKAEETKLVKLQSSSLPEADRQVYRLV